jgi:DNA-binding LacI/PurR family transcriptional regulator
MTSLSSSSRSKGPTIRDVARRAGVSVATVSRVLNDSPLVVEPTRARVQAAVDELGYHLNATARNLSIGRAAAIGVVVPFLTTPSVIERVRGVVE